MGEALTYGALAGAAAGVMRLLHPSVCAYTRLIHAESEDCGQELGMAHSGTSHRRRRAL